ncbi:MAG TPA: toxin-antitoxin system protein [Thermoanaerobaculia bacterium]|nr:toxin-antitoxin system protein [Thermoanaerobaculia bacterium]
MGHAMVRISEQAHQTLREMARTEHDSMQAVLEKAVEEYRRRRFLEDVNAAYLALREDPEAWKELEEERSAWDATLMDGLPEGESWTVEGFPAGKKST